METYIDFAVITDTNTWGIEKQLNDLLKLEDVEDVDVQGQSQGSNWYVDEEGKKEYVTHYTVSVKLKRRN